MNSSPSSTISPGVSVSLAPMEGIVDVVIRRLYSKIGGYDQFVTEFVRITQTLLPKQVFYRYCPELHNESKTAEGNPVFVQLLGGDPQCMAENAAKVAELGAYGIDINFGCPAKTVNRNDGGATLLKNPERVYQVVQAIRAAVPENIPVTAKVRLGFADKSQANDIAMAADRGGACRLTVHARTKLEGYRPPAFWHYIASMREQVNIPVVANGDIWTVDDFKRCREITGCTHFALGRPAMANPFLALQIRQAIDSPPSWDDIKKRWLSEFIEKSLQHKDETYAVSRTKQWSKLLAREFPEARQYFDSIKTKKTVQEISPL